MTRVESFVRFELRGGVGVITLDRPHAANAYHRPMLAELDNAWRQAEDDPQVRVIVLRAEGRHFCAGHDLREEAPVSDGSGLGSPAMFRRWRDIPKPTIAAVQGHCVAGGLLFAWVCDLIVAADDAQFVDPMVQAGLGGIVFAGHTWEVGARKAREMLFTGQGVGAQDAERLGMVNRVVPVGELERAAMDLAAHIATKPAGGLLRAKQAVAAVLDDQGFRATFDRFVEGVEGWPGSTHDPQVRPGAQVRASNVREV